MKKENIWAVLPVAGLSSRMGEFKPLMPLGEATILEQTISRFQEAGMKKILAVTGHRREEIRPLLEKSGVLEVRNLKYRESDMFYSIQLGVTEVLRRGGEGVFICPGDSPLVSPITIKELAEKGQRVREPALIPCFQEREGHPPLLKGRALSNLLNYKGEGGLKGYLNSLGKICRIPTEDAFLLMDADTPEDYERLKKAYDRYQEQF